MSNHFATTAVLIDRVAEDTPFPITVPSYLYLDGTLIPFRFRVETSKSEGLIVHVTVPADQVVVTPMEPPRAKGSRVTVCGVSCCTTRAEDWTTYEAPGDGDEKVAVAVEVGVYVRQLHVVPAGHELDPGRGSDGGKSYATRHPDYLAEGQSLSELVRRMDNVDAAVAEDEARESGPSERPAGLHSDTISSHAHP
jgi:hypothetical protein